MIARQLRLTVSLGIAGWTCFYVIGQPLLAYFFKYGASEIYRAGWIMMIGSVAVAALEPVTRLLMGIGRLTHLTGVRIAMLCASVLSVIALDGVVVIDRFAIAVSIGSLVMAAGLTWLNVAEPWGKLAVESLPD